MKNKVIAIVGPTASGKTELAKKLIQKFNGEVISVDSRQIYQGLDLGTGKDKSFRQYLIDIKKPEEPFSVVEFQKLARKTLNALVKRGKVPFLVGGTGYYLDAIIHNFEFPKIKPSPSLRHALESKDKEELYQKLAKYDPVSAKRVALNKRRLIRALEIVLQTQKPVPLLSKKKSDFNLLILGIDLPRQKLYRKIDKRVDERLEQGMIQEVRALIRQGVSKEWLRNLGLEYRFITDYLALRYTKEEMIVKLKFAIHAFARRQLTWFRRNKAIHWVKSGEEAEALIKTFFAAW